MEFDVIVWLKELEFVWVWAVETSQTAHTQIRSDSSKHTMTSNPIPHSEYTIRLWLESIPKVGLGGGKQRWGGSGYELKTESHIFCFSKVWSFCLQPDKTDHAQMGFEPFYNLMTLNLIPHSKYTFRLWL